MESTARVFVNPYLTKVLVVKVVVVVGILFSDILSMMLQQHIQIT